MQKLTIGKFRRLSQCLTPRGAISVLALDHRNNLRVAMNPQSPESVSAEMITNFKVAVIGALAPVSSAVLLDAEFGAAQSIASYSLPGQTGLLVSLEATGYTGDPSARSSRILPGFSVEKIRNIGASAIKFLVYYHPKAPTAAEIEQLVVEVAAMCNAADIPFFLEPLSYSPDPNQKKLSPADRKEVVLETARRLVVPGVDVLKAEFPLDIQANPDPRAWEEACAELSAACQVPWVLLSASVDYETFVRQVTAACQAGATGVAVGRAVWKESSGLTGYSLSEFLTQTAQPRMQRLTNLVDALGKPVHDFFEAEPVSELWYKQ